MEFIKSLIRPIYFWVFRMRGYPGVDLQEFKILAIKNEYNDVYTYDIEKPADLHFHAGYYAHVVAPSGHINNHDVRDMSFANAPSENSIKITMDLASNTRFKRKFRDAKVGDRVVFYAIKGDFTNDEIPQEKPCVYIAGGVGITAIRSLIVNRIQAPWQLIYAGKGYAYDELWNKHQDHVVKVKRDSLFPAIERSIGIDKQYFVCGTESFVTDVKAYLLNNGIEASQIKVEGFGGN